MPSSLADKNDQSMLCWRVGSGINLPLIGPAILMGILNVTPDSFSDGGQWLEADKAHAQALRLVQDGAAIIDVGAESTRPQAIPVNSEDEWQRLAPFLQKAAKVPLGVPLSLDTMKASVARKGLELGVQIINDVWGLLYDADMADVVADSDAGLVVMHNRATIEPALPIVQDVIRGLERSLERAAKAGIAANRIVVDPGIGFGKTFEQNLDVLAALPKLVKHFEMTGHALLLGVSRKSYIGRIVEVAAPARVPGTTATHVLARQAGVPIYRVHDVAEAKQALAVTDAIVQWPLASRT